MIVDTSAVMAVLKAEPEARSIAVALQSSPARMSVANLLECALVADNDPWIGPGELDAFVAEAGITPIAVSVEHGRIAREAHRRYGRGSGSPARLNFGDCFAYALAIEFGEPLLFKGDDFTHTDVTPAR